MSRDRKPAGWPDSVIAFIQRNLPGDGTAAGWSHRHITAFQIGCEVLAALGQAEETGWGARPLDHPRVPTLLPRWDDICVAVLKLSRQQDLLSYRLPDGQEMPAHAAWFGRQGGETPPPPNIAAGCGPGPAHAAPELLPVLRALDLIDDGRWTAPAELVLWREQPEEWRMDIAGDPRFAVAVDQAVASMPGAIHAELRRLVTITDQDIALGLARRKAYQAELIASRSRALPLPLTPQSMRNGLISVRRRDLDWLFFTGWRLPEGWLGPEARKAALEIFHDPLAIMMRRAVVARLWPDAPWMAE